MFIASGNSAREVAASLKAGRDQRGRVIMTIRAAALARRCGFVDAGFRIDWDLVDRILAPTTSSPAVAARA